MSHKFIVAEGSRIHHFIYIFFLTNYDNHYFIIHLSWDKQVFYYHLYYPSLPPSLTWWIVQVPLHDIWFIGVVWEDRTSSFRSTLYLASFPPYFPLWYLVLQQLILLAHLVHLVLQYLRYKKDKQWFIFDPLYLTPYGSRAKARVIIGSARKVKSDWHERYTRTQYYYYYYYYNFTPKMANDNKLSLLFCKVFAHNKRKRLLKKISRTKWHSI